MNPGLVRVLMEAGVPGRLDWRDVVVWFNYAPVPPPAFPAAAGDWTRGFNLVVLSQGVPAHFAKCRPSNDPVLQRETAIRSFLAEQHVPGVSVAPVRSASSDQIAVQVARFLLGPNYGSIVRRQDTDSYLHLLRATVEGNAMLSRLARTYLGGPAVIDVTATAAEYLADVAHLAALDDREVSALTSVVSDVGETPSLPQHGDFWWQNLVVIAGHVWILDFDSYGDTRAPLFDAITLVLTTLGLRAGGDAVKGLETLISEGAEARACRTLLGDCAAADGVAASQMDGLLVYYLAKMASVVHARGGAGFAEPHVAAVRRVAQLLAAGKHLMAPQ